MSMIFGHFIWSGFLAVLLIYKTNLNHNLLLESESSSSKAEERFQRFIHSPDFISLKNDINQAGNSMIHASLQYDMLISSSRSGDTSPSVSEQRALINNMTDEITALQAKLGELGLSSNEEALQSLHSMQTQVKQLHKNTAALLRLGDPEFDSELETISETLGQLSGRIGRLAEGFATLVKEQDETIETNVGALVQASSGRDDAAWKLLFTSTFSKPINDVVFSIITLIYKNVGYTPAMRFVSRMDHSLIQGMAFEHLYSCMLARDDVYHKGNLFVFSYYLEQLVSHGVDTNAVAQGNKVACSLIPVTKDALFHPVNFCSAPCCLYPSGRCLREEEAGAGSVPLSMRVMVSSPSDDLTALLTHFDMVWGQSEKIEILDQSRDWRLTLRHGNGYTAHTEWITPYHKTNKTFVGFCPPPLNNQEGFGKIPCWTGTMPTQLYSDFGHNVLNNCV